jgi:hypothetical protein
MGLACLGPALVFPLFILKNRRGILAVLDAGASELLELTVHTT